MDIINETNALIKKARKQELRYIDPANLDNYDKDDIEKVRDANGNVRYKRKATSTGSKQAGKKGGVDNGKKQDKPRAISGGNKTVLKLTGGSPDCSGVDEGDFFDNYNDIMNNLRLKTKEQTELFGGETVDSMGDYADSKYIKKVKELIASGVATEDSDGSISLKPGVEISVEKNKGSKDLWQPDEPGLSSTDFIVYAIKGGKKYQIPTSDEGATVYYEFMPYTELA